MSDNVTYLSANATRVIAEESGIQLTDIDAFHGIILAAYADGLTVGDLLSLFTCGVKTVSDLDVAFQAFRSGRGLK